MKKLLVAASLFLTVQVNAQVSEGIIKYKMELEGQGNKAMLGNLESTVYFKKDKSLLEMTTPFYTMKTLTDANGVLLLSEINGKKQFKRTTAAEAREQAKKITTLPKIETTTEKKTVLGYECTKSIVTMTGNNAPTTKMIVWSTSKISNAGANVGGLSPEVAAKLKGAPLEIHVEGGPAPAVIYATSVSTKPVPDAVFNLSTAGYTEAKKN